MLPFPFGRSKSVSNSSRTKAARRRWLERLEDRTVRTATALAGTVDFDSLRIDPQSYDAATILVRFRDGADGLRGDDIFRGTEIGKGSKLVAGLHTVNLR